ncbi:MAG: decaprenylphospho-beta-D-erythro-pentofuranosid-2-ulose 2-reductase [Methylophilaceae bacterium]|jgi:decaprenylphospho-beta-D-erythro-pentofuranosid-2-ulose 2-reductase
MHRTRIVIIGATSAIAEHCARLWVVESPVDLILVGRDLAKIDLVASDLRVRSPLSNIKSLHADFVDPVKIQALVDGIVNDGEINIALIAHGSLPEQQQCQENLNMCSDALVVNGVSPVLFAEAFAGHMQKVNAGTLAIIGSVAGDRGRKSNYVYGAAKGLVTCYAQGLQHRLAKTGVKVVLIKPGPTDTPMTAHLKQQGSNLANVEDVSKHIVKTISQGKSLVYVPAKWALIMMIIRHLPVFIFKKMDI